jgi:hypothetical protein
MLNFSDQDLQKLIGSVFWDGKVSDSWGGDYLMTVDANMGAMKTDYYMRRSISYDVDLTQTKPVVTLNILYKNTAPYGDWRTSDYHSYLRVYAPKGSNFLERKMVGYPNISEEFNKTVFGVKVDVLIGKETAAMIKYELPETLDRDNYRILIQKQSGVNNTEIKVHAKTKNDDFNYSGVLTKDLNLQITKK